MFNDDNQTNAPATDTTSFIEQPVNPALPPQDPVANSAPPANDLQDIKSKALAQLSPLLQHLDQQPEEKFKTLMMLIQTTDDSSLLPQAYAAAEQISDDAAKAQALLDVVNEVNYFAQEQSDKAPN